jgi:DNA primase
VLGTSTTPDHAALVRRSGAKRVTLVFDGDEAGGRASGRALVGLIPLGIQIDVAVPPPGRDPGDLLLAPEGDAAFRELLEGARDWFAWSLAGLAGLAGPGLAEAVDERLRLVLLLATPVERAQRIAELAGFLRLPERALWGQAERLRAPLPRTAAPAEPGPLSRDTGPAGPGPSPAEVTAFRCLIGALLLDNSLIPLCADLQDRCPEGDLSAVFRAVLELYEEGEEEALIDADAVMTWLGDHPARNLVVAVEDLALRAESPEALVRAQLAWLERRERERRLQELTEHLCAPTPGASTAPEVLESIHRELRRSRVP